MVDGTGNIICLVTASIVSLAGIFVTFIRRKNRKNVVIRPSVKITYPWKLTLGDYAWIGDEVNLYTLGEITIGAHSVISQKVICVPAVMIMQVTISLLTPCQL